MSLVELITSSIDTISASSSSYLHPSQRTEGIASPEMIQRHFRDTLQHIYGKKTSESPGRYAKVEVVGAFLKMGITRGPGGPGVLDLWLYLVHDKHHRNIESYRFSNCVHVIGSISPS